jgi:plasmid stabilization system protein ParE
VSLPVVWSDEAKAELYEAEQWYADISVHLSERFVEAVESTVQLIAEFPLRFPVVYRERRRAGVRRFTSTAATCLWAPINRRESRHDRS